MKNYIQIIKFSLLYYYFMYIDTKDYLADDLFINENINVKYRGEFRRKDEKYIIVECKVRKNSVNKFLEIMEKFKNKMLLFGYNDYEKFCNEIFKYLKENKNWS